MTFLSCIDCRTTISTQSKSGRCRPCALRARNADPAFNVKRLAALALAMADPAVRARHREGAKRGAAKRMADPVKAEALRDLGRRVGAKNIVHALTPEARAKCAKACRAHHLAWCPEEYWSLNYKLKCNGYRLPDRQRIIGETVAKNAAQAQRAAEAAQPELSPFERQLARVAAGAKLIPAFNPRKIGPERTLGGVTPEII